MSPAFLRDIGSLPGDRLYGAFVHFAAGTAADHRSLLGGFGFKITHDYERYAKAVFAVGTIDAFRSLSGDRSVAYLEANERLQYDMNTAAWATRVRVAQEGVSGGPYKDASGRVLRGQGVTIVVVDSGLNALHPDFAGRVKHNWKIVCSTPELSDSATGLCFGPSTIVDVGQTDSDTTGGHGTHCAGIAAGSGAASTGDYGTVAPNVKGTHTGVAPDANLIAYGAGEGLQILTAVDAYAHLLDNWDPTIKAVSNSWGSSGAYDPNSMTSKLTKLIVAKGAAVIRSAGNGDTLNDGGDGSDDRTRSQCKDPTPGVICVANVDDGGTGSRAGNLDFSSSRGLKTNPLTWPDIAAPGTLITATCTQPQPGQAVCTSGETTWQPYYGTISGTSMSTPHVAGAVALLAQANPSLTPAQIESIMKQTALKVTTNGAYAQDPRDPNATINFGLGAGLLDVPAALTALGTSHGALPASGIEMAIFAGYHTAGVAGAADVQKLTMQEATVNGLNGVRYRLTVANGGGFVGASSGLIYRLSQNVNGLHFVTQISATPAGVANLDAHNGNASAVSRSGNVVTFFVPYVQIGLPGVGSPIHNISVSVLDAGSGLPVNYAPHPANSTGRTEALQPMYGKAFTVQLTANGGGESSCLVPGVTILTDGLGDNLAPTPGSDLQGLSVAEPHAATLADTKLVFTLFTDPGRALQPYGSGWYVSFLNPRDHKVYGARMVYGSTAPRFESYLASGSLNTSDPNAQGQTDGRFADVTKPADPNSNYDHKSGTITLIVPLADVNLQPGDAIAGFNAGSTFSTNPNELPGPSATDVWDFMPNSGYLGNFATYDAVGTAVCPATAAPVPRIAPRSLSFGDQTVATKSTARTVTYTNTWTKPLPINAISVASQDSVGDFVQTNDCPSALPVGASCRIDVQFRPLQAGARAGTLTIVANNGRRTDAVSLSGNGVQ